MCRAVLVMWVMTSSNRWISDIANVARQAWDVNIENCLASGPRGGVASEPNGGAPSARRLGQPPHAPASRQLVQDVRALLVELGRASCRERGLAYMYAG